MRMENFIEDYHLHVRTASGARRYIEYLSKIGEEENKKFKISFSQHESFDLYKNFPTVDYGKRLEVEIIPSITFMSQEGIEIIVMNPKDNAFELLDLCIKERTDRICNILYSLMDIGILLTPKKLLQSVGRGNIEDLYLIEDITILDVMVEEGIEGCENIDSANANYLSRVNLKRLYIPFEEIVSKLCDEDVQKPENVYIATPDIYLEYMSFLKKNNMTGLYNKSKQIKGIIIDPDNMTPGLSDFFMENGREIRVGSGRTVD